MSNPLEILKEIGAQTIHNETHISKDYVQAIIHETFDDLQPVQFVGFVSILEREYNLDLSDLKAKGKAYFIEVNQKPNEVKNVFVVPKTKKNYSKLYLFLGISLFVSFLYYSVSYVNSISSEFEDFENTIEQESLSSSEFLVETEVIVPIVEEINTTEVNTTSVPLQEDLNTSTQKIETIIEEKIIPRSLKILPKNRVWAGYINIKTNKKYQKVFKKEFVMDIEKDWLLLFGSGTVKLEVNGEIVKFTSSQNMRFKYKDGVFSKITVNEFKKLNKGRKW